MRWRERENSFQVNHKSKGSGRSCKMMFTKEKDICEAEKSCCLGVPYCFINFEPPWQSINIILSKALIPWKWFSSPFQHRIGPSFQCLEQCSLAVPLQSYRWNKEFFSSTCKYLVQGKKQKIMSLKNSPTATFVNPGRSMRVKLTTAKKEWCKQG